MRPRPLLLIAVAGVLALAAAATVRPARAGLLPPLPLPPLPSVPQLPGSGGSTTLPTAPAPAAQPAATPSGWVATGTHALNLAATRLGPAPADQRLVISAALPLRNRDQIAPTIESGRILTPEEVAATFGPTPDQVQAVESYFAANGFRNVSAAPNGLLVTGDATVAQAEQAFATAISSYVLNGKAVYANTLPALVPASLAGDVVSVLGLSDIPMSMPDPPQMPNLNGFGPAAVANAYDDSSMQAATGTEIAIIASGDMSPTIDHLRFAESQFGFPQVPVRVVFDGPKGGIVNGNPLTGNLEWDLDMQVSTMVPKAVRQLDVYDVATFTDPEVTRGINMFVSEDKAIGLSASLGECDSIAFLDGAMVATDNVLAEGALQGQSMFASTGDNGYACPVVASTGLPEGPPGQSWPADGEYTTAVGGTTLLADGDGNVQNEVAWIGGGGGISPYETAAPWTLQANTAGQAWEFTNQGGRGVPDVSAVADPNTPYLVYGSDAPGTQPTGVGGTSVSSPLTLGLWASIESALDNRAGLAQYAFYRTYNSVNPATANDAPTGTVYVAAANPSPVTGFRDITLGTNGGCVAGAGYDYCTGIGALQAHALSTQIGPEIAPKAAEQSGGKPTGTSRAAPPTGGVAGAHATKRHSVRAHGAVHVRGRKGTATFSVGRGLRVLYVDRVHGIRFRSLRILGVGYGAHVALIKGLGLVNGRKVRFTARAIDHGRRGDIFRIAWTHGGARGGKLVRGSVVVS